MNLDDRNIFVSRRLDRLHHRQFIGQSRHPTEIEILSKADAQIIGYGFASPSPRSWLSIVKRLIATLCGYPLIKCSVFLGEAFSRPCRAASFAIPPRLEARGVSCRHATIWERREKTAIQNNTKLVS